MTIFSFSDLGLISRNYEQYKQDRESVDPSWRSFFDGWELGALSGAPAAPSSDLRIYFLIEAYRNYGHFAAKVNPLASSSTPKVPELAIERYGFTSDDLDKKFPTCGFLKEKEALLKDMIGALEKTYADSVGIEYMGLRLSDMEKWIQSKVEPLFPIPLTASDKMEILANLNRAEIFEVFLHTKYVGQKRFSLEGGETAIPMLSAMIEEMSQQEVDEVVIGMAHRGRLNVLVNILSKSYESVFQEFEDHYTSDLLEGTGDVKYHKGFAGHLKTKSGKEVLVTLTANPSHLESVDPVVEGQTKAKQMIRGEKTVVPILIHGDAALSGQGVVYETLQLGKLKGYGTGGTIHLVINNQIGYTTLPKDSRSTYYCTDIARAFGAPVFHINAEKPEECVMAALLAVQIRQRFHCDVFLDLNCYRKYGHNESDEPAFTQPLEYQVIHGKESIRHLYQAALIQEGILKPEEAMALEAGFRSALAQALEKALPQQESKNGVSPLESAASIPTKVSAQKLRELAADFCQVPEGFHLHPKIQKLLTERLKMMQEGGIDWGMGEHLAFASLLSDGIHIRLSGQDVRRGTFSHRHALWVDQVQEDKRYSPLSHLKNQQALFDIYNSSLSEFAVLGFEFGYSLSFPKSLVIWEAQFGDFSNGAQVILDQYIACSEQKWGVKTNLTLLLPHGYEGQGPEHSSARIERFLQLSGHNNMIVCNCTTPAQFFHVLRRQGLSSDKKPLILFTPKVLLRHPACVSSVSDFETGGFEEFLASSPKEQTRRLIFCSGKVYYDLIAACKNPQINFVRIEQLYPFKTDKFKSLLSKYGAVKEFFWVQEEPQNMGAWEYLQPILESACGSSLRYVGRERSAAPAVGSYAVHKKELSKLLEEALS